MQVLYLDLCSSPFNQTDRTYSPTCDPPRPLIGGPIPLAGGILPRIDLSTTGTPLDHRHPNVLIGLAAMDRAWRQRI